MSIEKECRNQAEKLGLGYDSFNDEIVPNSAIEYSEEDVHQDTKGQDTFFLERVENKQSLGTILSGSISGGFSFCGTLFGAEAKGRYFSQVDINTESTYLLLQYQFTGGSCRIANNPKLSATAKNLLHETKSNPNEFRRVYGDEFILGFRKGAEYNALIQIHSTSGINKNEIAIEARAYIQSFINIGVEGQGGKYTSNSFASKNTTVYCYRTGMSIEDQSTNVPLDVDDMIQDFHQFKKGLAKTKGKENIAFFEDYDRLIDTRGYTILTPQLKSLKKKLDILRKIKRQKEAKLIMFCNQSRFDNNNNYGQEINQLNNSIYDIDNFIRRCDVEPDLIDSEQYRKFIKEG